LKDTPNSEERGGTMAFDAAFSFSLPRERSR